MPGGARTDLGLDGAYVPARTPGVVAVDVDGEAVLVDEVTSQLHLLNGSGALLWACFDGASSLSDICADVAEGLEVPSWLGRQPGVRCTAACPNAGGR